MRVAILLSDKVDFRAKQLPEEKKVHYIMIKRSIYEGGIVVLNMCAPKTGPQNTPIKADKAESRNRKNPQL